VVSLSFSPRRDVNASEVPSWLHAG
jgi:hypothetical protein